MRDRKFTLREYAYPLKGAVLDTIEDLLDTLLIMLDDGDLAAWPNLEATTRYQFETLGVEFAEEDEEDDDGAE